MIRRYIFIYLACWLVGLLVFVFVNQNALLSFSVAFFCSGLIFISSFYGYRRKVIAKLRDNLDEILDEADDDIDNENMTKLRDNLNEILDDNNQSNKQQLQDLDPSQIIKQEKSRKRGLEFKNIGTAFLPFRLIAYVILVLCFLILLRHQMLNIMAFLVGILLSLLATIAVCKVAIQMDKE